MFKLAAMGHVASASTPAAAATQERGHHGHGGGGGDGDGNSGGSGGLQGLFATGGQIAAAAAAGVTPLDGAGLTEEEFHLHVIARLQSLLSLDGRVVTPEDKVERSRLFLDVLSSSSLSFSSLFVHLSFILSLLMF